MKWNFGSAQLRSEYPFFEMTSLTDRSKVLTIIGLIIAGIIISAGGGPNGESIGFKYWNETGGFMQFEGIGKIYSNRFSDRPK